MVLSETGGCGGEDGNEADSPGNSLPEFLSQHSRQMLWCLVNLFIGIIGYYILMILIILNFLFMGARQGTPQHMCGDWRTICQKSALSAV